VYLQTGQGTLDVEHHVSGNLFFEIYSELGLTGHYAVLMVPGAPARIAVESPDSVRDYQTFLVKAKLFDQYDNTIDNGAKLNLQASGGWSNQQPYINSDADIISTGIPLLQSGDCVGATYFCTTGNHKIHLSEQFPSTGFIDDVLPTGWNNDGSGAYQTPLFGEGVNSFWFYTIIDDGVGYPYHYTIQPSWWVGGSDRTAAVYGPFNYDQDIVEACGYAQQNLESHQDSWFYDPRRVGSDGIYLDQAGLYIIMIADASLSGFDKDRADQPDLYLNVIAPDSVSSTNQCNYFRETLVQRVTGGSAFWPVYLDDWCRPEAARLSLSVTALDYPDVKAGVAQTNLYCDSLYIDAPSTSLVVNNSGFVRVIVPYSETGQVDLILSLTDIAGNVVWQGQQASAGGGFLANYVEFLVRAPISAGSVNAVAKVANKKKWRINDALPVVLTILPDCDHSGLVVKENVRGQFAKHGKQLSAGKNTGFSFSFKDQFWNRCDSHSFCHEFHLYYIHGWAVAREQVWFLDDVAPDQEPLSTFYQNSDVRLAFNNTFQSFFWNVDHDGFIKAIWTLDSRIDGGDSNVADATGMARLVPNEFVRKVLIQSQLRHAGSFVSRFTTYLEIETDFQVIRIGKQFPFFDEGIINPRPKSQTFQYTQGNVVLGRIVAVPVTRTNTLIRLGVELRDPVTTYSDMESSQRLRIYSRTGRLEIDSVFSSTGGNKYSDSVFVRSGYYTVYLQGLGASDYCINNPMDQSTYNYHIPNTERFDRGTVLEVDQGSFWESSWNSDVFSSKEQEWVNVYVAPGSPSRLSCTLKSESNSFRSMQDSVTYNVMAYDSFDNPTTTDRALVSLQPSKGTGSWDLAPTPGTLWRGGRDLSFRWDLAGDKEVLAFSTWSTPDGFDDSIAAGFMGCFVDPDVVTTVIDLGDEHDTLTWWQDEFAQPSDCTSACQVNGFPYVMIRQQSIVNTNFGVPGRDTRIQCICGWSVNEASARFRIADEMCDGGCRRSDNDAVYSGYCGGSNPGNTALYKIGDWRYIADQLQVPCPAVTILPGVAANLKLVSAPCDEFGSVTYTSRALPQPDASRVRIDGKCGILWPSPAAHAGECDPEGELPVCSPSGNCVARGSPGVDFSLVAVQGRARCPAVTQGTALQYVLQFFDAGGNVADVFYGEKPLIGQDVVLYDVAPGEEILEKVIFHRVAEDATVVVDVLVGLANRCFTPRFYAPMVPSIFTPTLCVEAKAVDHLMPAQAFPEVWGQYCPQPIITVDLVDVNHAHVLWAEADVSIAAEGVELLGSTTTRASSGSFQLGGYFYSHAVPLALRLSATAADGSVAQYEFSATVAPATLSIEVLPATAEVGQLFTLVAKLRTSCNDNSALNQDGVFVHVNLLGDHEEGPFVAQVTNGIAIFETLSWYVAEQVVATVSVYGETQIAPAQRALSITAGPAVAIRFISPVVPFGTTALNVAAGGFFSATVEAVDFFGNRATGYSGDVTLSASAEGSDHSFALAFDATEQSVPQCQTEGIFAFGVATFSDCYLTEANSFALSVTTGPAWQPMSAQFFTIDVLASDPNFVAVNLISPTGFVNPSVFRADEKWLAQAIIRDYYGNQIQGFQGSIEIKAHGIFPLVADSAVLDVVNGIVTFTGLQYSVAGNLLVECAVVDQPLIHPGLADVYIRHGTPTTIVVQDSAPTATAGEPLAITVHVVDAFSNEVDVCSNPDVISRGWKLTGKGKNSALSYFNVDHPFATNALRGRRLLQFGQSVDDLHIQCVTSEGVNFLGFANWGQNCAVLTSDTFSTMPIQVGFLDGDAAFSTVVEDNIFVYDENAYVDVPVFQEVDIPQSTSDYWLDLFAPSPSVSTEVNVETQIELELLLYASDCQAFAPLCTGGDSVWDLTSTRTCPPTHRRKACCPDINGAVRVKTCGAPVTFTPTYDLAETIRMKVVGTGNNANLEPAQVSPVAVQHASLAVLEFANSVPYAIQGQEFGLSLYLVARDYYGNKAYNEQACVTVTELADGEVDAYGISYTASTRGELQPTSCYPLENGEAWILGLEYSAPRPATNPLILKASTQEGLFAVHHCPTVIAGLRLSIVSLPSEVFAGEDFTVNAIVETQDINGHWIPYTTGDFASLSSVIQVRQLNPQGSIVVFQSVESAVNGELSFQGLSAVFASTFDWDTQLWRGQLYVEVTSADAAAAEAGPIRVLPAAPETLLLTSYVKEVAADQRFTVTGEVRDRFGNLIDNNDSSHLWSEVVVHGVHSLIQGEHGVHFFVFDGVWTADMLFTQESSLLLPDGETQICVSTLNVFDKISWDEVVLHACFAITVTSAAPANLVLDVGLDDTSACLTVSDEVEVKVFVKDRFGNLCTQSQETIQLSLVSPSGNRFIGENLKTASGGWNIFYIRLYTAETVSFVAAPVDSVFAPNYISPFFTSRSLTFHHGQATHVMIQQPTSVEVLEKFSAINVQYLDAFDNYVWTSSLNAACAADDSMAYASLTLSPTMGDVQTAVDGVVSYPVESGSWTIPEGTISYTLATWLFLDLETSASFVPRIALTPIEVRAGPPALLQILQQPTEGISGTEFATPFVLQYQDAAGNVLHPPESGSLDTIGELVTAETGRFDVRKNSWSVMDVADSDVANGYFSLQTEVKLPTYGESLLFTMANQVLILQLSTGTTTLLTTTGPQPAFLPLATTASWEFEGVEYVVFIGGGWYNQITSMYTSAPLPAHLLALRRDSSNNVISATWTDITDYTWNVPGTFVRGCAYYADHSLHIVNQVNLVESTPRALTYVRVTFAFDFSSAQFSTPTTNENPVLGMDSSSAILAHSCANHNGFIKEYNSRKPQQIVVFDIANAQFEVIPIGEPAVPFFLSITIAQSTQLHQQLLFVNHPYSVDVFALDLNTYTWSTLEVDSASLAARPPSFDSAIVIADADPLGLHDRIIMRGLTIFGSDINNYLVLDLGFVPGVVPLIGSQNKLTGLTTTAASTSGKLWFGSLLVTLFDPITTEQNVQVRFCLQGGAVCATSKPITIQSVKLVFPDGSFPNGPHTVVAGKPWPTPSFRVAIRDQNGGTPTGSYDLTLGVRIVRAEGPVADSVVTGAVIGTLAITGVPTAEGVEIPGFLNLMKSGVVYVQAYDAAQPPSVQATAPFAIVVVPSEAAQCSIPNPLPSTLAAGERIVPSVSLLDAYGNPAVCGSERGAPSRADVQRVLIQSVIVEREQGVQTCNTLCASTAQCVQFVLFLESGECFLLLDVLPIVDTLEAAVSGLAGLLPCPAGVVDAYYIGADMIPRSFSSGLAHQHALRNVDTDVLVELNSWALGALQQTMWYGEHGASFQLDATLAHNIDSHEIEFHETAFSEGHPVIFAAGWVQICFATSFAGLSCACSAHFIEAGPAHRVRIANYPSGKGWYVGDSLTVDSVLVDQFSNVVNVNPEVFQVSDKGAASIFGEVYSSSSSDLITNTGFYFKEAGYKQLAVSAYLIGADIWPSILPDTAPSIKLLAGPAAGLFQTSPPPAVVTAGETFSWSVALVDSYFNLITEETVGSDVDLQPVLEFSLYMGDEFYHTHPPIASQMTNGAFTTDISVHTKAEVIQIRVQPAQRKIAGINLNPVTVTPAAPVSLVCERPSADHIHIGIDNPLPAISAALVDQYNNLVPDVPEKHYLGCFGSVLDAAAPIVVSIDECMTRCVLTHDAFAFANGLCVCISPQQVAQYLPDSMCAVDCPTPAACGGDGAWAAYLSTSAYYLYVTADRGQLTGEPWGTLVQGKGDIGSTHWLPDVLIQDRIIYVDPLVTFENYDIANGFAVTFFARFKPGTPSAKIVAGESSFALNYVAETAEFKFSLFGAECVSLQLPLDAVVADWHYFAVTYALGACTLVIDGQIAGPALAPVPPESRVVTSIDIGRFTGSLMNAFVFPATIAQNGSHFSLSLTDQAEADGRFWAGLPGKVGSSPWGIANLGADIVRDGCIHNAAFSAECLGDVTLTVVTQVPGINPCVIQGTVQVDRVELRLAPYTQVGEPTTITVYVHKFDGTGLNTEEDKEVSIEVRPRRDYSNDLQGFFVGGAQSAILTARTGNTGMATFTVELRIPHDNIVNAFATASTMDYKITSTNVGRPVSYAISPRSRYQAVLAGQPVAVEVHTYDAFGFDATNFGERCVFTSYASKPVCPDYSVPLTIVSYADLSLLLQSNPAVGERFLAPIVFVRDAVTNVWTWQYSSFLTSDAGAFPSTHSYDFPLKADPAPDHDCAFFEVVNTLRDDTSIVIVSDLCPKADDTLLLCTQRQHTDDICPGIVTADGTVNAELVSGDAQYLTSDTQLSGIITDGWASVFPIAYINAELIKIQVSVHDREGNALLVPSDDVRGNFADIVVKAGPPRFAYCNPGHDQHLDLSSPAFPGAEIGEVSVTITVTDQYGNPNVSPAHSEVVGGIWILLREGAIGGFSNKQQYGEFLTSGALTVQGLRMTTAGSFRVEPYFPDALLPIEYVETESSCSFTVTPSVPSSLWCEASASNLMIGETVDYTITVYDEFYNIVPTIGGTPVVQSSYTPSHPFNANPDVLTFVWEEGSTSAGVGKATLGERRSAGTHNVVVNWDIQFAGQRVDLVGSTISTTCPDVTFVAGSIAGLVCHHSPKSIVIGQAWTESPVAFAVDANGNIVPEPGTAQLYTVEESAIPASTSGLRSTKCAPDADGVCNIYPEVAPLSIMLDSFFWTWDPSTFARFNTSTFKLQIYEPMSNYVIECPDTVVTNVFFAFSDWPVGSLEADDALAFAYVLRDSTTYIHEKTGLTPSMTLRYEDFVVTCTCDASNAGKGTCQCPAFTGPWNLPDLETNVHPTARIFYPTDPKGYVETSLTFGPIVPDRQTPELVIDVQPPEWKTTADVWSFSVLVRDGYGNVGGGWMLEIQHLGNEYENSNLLGGRIGYTWNGRYTFSGLQFIAPHQFTLAIRAVPLDGQNTPAAATTNTIRIYPTQPYSCHIETIRDIETASSSPSFSKHFVQVRDQFGNGVGSSSSMHVGIQMVSGSGALIGGEKVPYTALELLYPCYFSDCSSSQTQESLSAVSFNSLQYCVAETISISCFVEFEDASYDGAVPLGSPVPVVVNAGEKNGLWAWGPTEVNVAEQFQVGVALVDECGNIVSCGGAEPCDELCTVSVQGTDFEHLFPTNTATIGAYTMGTEPWTVFAIRYRSNPDFTINNNAAFQSTVDGTDWMNVAGTMGDWTIVPYANGAGLALLCEKSSATRTCTMHQKSSVVDFVGRKVAVQARLATLNADAVAGTCQVSVEYRNHYHRPLGTFTVGDSSLTAFPAWSAWELVHTVPAEAEYEVLTIQCVTANIGDSSSVLFDSVSLALVGDESVTLEVSCVGVTNPTTVGPITVITTPVEPPVVPVIIEHCSRASTCFNHGDCTTDVDDVNLNDFTQYCRANAMEWCCDGKVKHEADAEFRSCLSGGQHLCELLPAPCKCDRDDLNGYWDGANCNTCFGDYYGENCNLRPCPIGANGLECAGHGFCDGHGNCVCDATAIPVVEGAATLNDDGTADTVYALLMNSADSTLQVDFGCSGGQCTKQGPVEYASCAAAYSDLTARGLDFSLASDVLINGRLRRCTVNEGQMWVLLGSVPVGASLAEHFNADAPFPNAEYENENDSRHFVQSTEAPQRVLLSAYNVPNDSFEIIVLSKIDLNLWKLESSTFIVEYVFATGDSKPFRDWLDLLEQFLGGLSIFAQSGADAAFQFNPNFVPAQFGNVLAHDFVFWTREVSTLEGLGVRSTYKFAHSVPTHPRGVVYTSQIFVTADVPAAATADMFRESEIECHFTSSQAQNHKYYLWGENKGANAKFTVANGKLTFVGDFDVLTDDLMDFQCTFSTTTDQPLTHVQTFLSYVFTRAVQRLALTVQADTFNNDGVTPTTHRLVEIFPITAINVVQLGSHYNVLLDMQGTAFQVHEFDSPAASVSLSFVVQPNLLALEVNGVVIPLISDGKNVQIELVPFHIRFGGVGSYFLRSIEVVENENTLARWDMILRDKWELSSFPFGDLELTYTQFFWVGELEITHESSTTAEIPVPSLGRRQGRGEWDGKACEWCLPGFVGAGCDQVLCDSTSCGEHGECVMDQRSVLYGQCNCAFPYMGVGCTACRPPYESQIDTVTKKAVCVASRCGLSQFKPNAAGVCNAYDVTPIEVDCMNALCPSSEVSWDECGCKMHGPIVCSKGTGPTSANLGCVGANQRPDAVTIDCRGLPNPFADTDAIIDGCGCPEFVARPICQPGTEGNRHLTDHCLMGISKFCGEINNGTAERAAFEE